MLSFQGVGATNGKGSGIAVIHKKISGKINETFYGDEAKDLYNQIKELALAEIDTLVEMCNEDEEEDILCAHKMMLEDTEVNKKIYQEIDNGEDLLNAIRIVQEQYYNQFQAMENEVFSSKALDVEDVFNRLLDNIKKQKQLKSINKNFILICDELLPTTIYDYPQDFLKGIIVKKGTMFSHGIIIAKSKNIPVVIGLGFDTAKIMPNDYLVIDGLTGKVVVISEWFF